ncbi:right-handed parallel beta-helix repeat-containing protein [Actinoplanes sp. LDG1-06]|uniref:Right-handed parallel beta-helix repeat-containing protein n=1 Tax=Paractinoplanes ovalisporus TaxID=2810368 RepID=A0ABS2AHM6_9ACTN|nr:right-handed parallel beta-helix repeat-containing protein [Actinoplanes ovalisporus]MBM2619315.1 right-handed parallel beta-helix repeat-containing protein [Actinoplanes ovalisporus]
MKSASQLVPGIDVVAEYGVDPTGRTDETERINRLIREAAPGSALSFPEGTFRVSGEIVVARGDITVAGSGPGTVFVADAAAETGIRIRGSDAGEIERVVLSQLTIEGQGLLEFGILLDGRTSDSWITGTNVRNCWHAGIRLWGGADQGRTVHDIRLVNNRIGVIRGSVPGQGIELMACRGITVTGSTIQTCTAAAIAVYGCQDSEVSRNYASVCGLGISVQVDGSGGLPSQPGAGDDWRFSRNLDIRDNELQHCGRSFDVREGTDGVSVTGNRVTLDINAASALKLYKAESGAFEGWPIKNFVFESNTITVEHVAPH